MSELKENTATHVDTDASDHGVSFISHFTGSHKQLSHTLQETKGAVTEVRVITGSEAMAEARLKEPPAKFSGPALLLYLCAFVGFFCSTCNGFDGSMFNALLTNKVFKSYYKVESDGAWAGIVTSMYQIGGVIAIPFIGPACDTWGRRYGMMIGGAIGVAGVLVQSTAPANNPVGQFMGGRFLLGFAGKGFLNRCAKPLLTRYKYPS